MRRGWLIYDSKGAERNRWFIGECLRLAAEKGLSLGLKIYDGAPFESHPDFALVRTISPALSADLQGAGARLFNSSAVSCLANDKWQTYLSAKAMGIVTLPTQLSACSKEDSSFGYPVVVKSRDGHGGAEVYKIDSQIEYQTFFKDHLAERYITQAFCSEVGKDLRVYVLGGRILAGVLRTSKVDFRSNFSLGGTVECIPVPQEIQKVVESLQEKYAFDFVGIDFIRHEGQWVLNEIEDVVGSRMLYQTTSLDVARLYIEYVADVVKKL